jgi:hypothetical protein
MASALGRGRCEAIQTRKVWTKAGHVTGTSHFMRTSWGNKKGQPVTGSGPFDFAKYKRPQSEGPMTHARADLAESADGEMRVQNLGDLLDRVSKNSTGEIDSLIGEFQRLRGKLQSDGERIKREIEEYRTLSQLVIQMTNTVSESVEKVRATVAQEKE